MKQTILLDLDGTIINSEEGITKSVQFALHCMGIEEEDRSKFKVFIGPPLVDSFMKYFGMTREEGEQAVAHYRERFHATGYKEFRVYDGVDQALKHWKEQGICLGLASLKPEEFCLKIMEYSGLASYFDTIVGASFDASRDTKEAVLLEAAKRLQQPPEDMVLVGDTEFDALGAVKAGMDCVGVSYGFGTREELQEAGVVTICDSIEEVVNYLETEES